MASTILTEEKRCTGCSEIIESGEVFFRWMIDEEQSDYCWACDGELRDRGIEATDGAKIAIFAEAIKH